MCSAHHSKLRFGGVQISLLSQEGSLSVSRGRFGLSTGVPFLCEECSGSAHYWIPECWAPAKPLAADVMSQTDTLVFVSLPVMLCGFWRSLFILASASAHGRLFLSLSLCVSWPTFPPLNWLCFYECVQYLMEAKKAQQSLESTYKQLDSVSPTKASVIMLLQCIFLILLRIF